MKKIIGILMILVLIILTGCGSNNITSNTNNTNNNAAVKKNRGITLNIMSTDKFLYYAVKDIVGNKHDVDYMFNNKDKLWNFSHTDDSLYNISKQDLFIYSGAGLEPWMDDFLNNLDKDHVGVINASRGVKLSSYSEPVKYKNIEITDNPYYWMNIDNYKIELLNIKNAVEERDPENRSYYEDNFTKALKAIEPYEKQLEDISAKLKDYSFVTEGDDLDYFTLYNGFKTIKFYGVESTLPPDEKNNLEAKFQQNANMIFLYDEESELKLNADIVEKFKMKPVNIIVYSDTLKYSDILKYNIESLEKVIQ